MAKLVVLVIITLAYLQGNQATIPTVNGGTTQTASLDEQVSGNTQAISLSSSNVGFIYCILSGTDASSFTSSAIDVVGAAASCSITINPSPDYQVAASYTFTATVHDSSTDFTAVAVTVNIVNKSPVCPSEQYAVDLADNSSAGTAVQTVLASPVTNGDSVAYSIVFGNTNSEFAIDSTSGVITIASGQSVSSSTLKGYILVVFATTGTGTVYTGTCTVFVTVGVCSSGASLLVGALPLLVTAFCSLLIHLPLLQHAFTGAV